MDWFWEILLHALKDTAPLIPWILFIYVLIELLESKTSLQTSGRLSGKFGPIIGYGVDSALRIFRDGV